MTTKSTRVLAGLLAISAVGFAQAVDTLNFATTTIQAIDPFGDASNIIYPGPNASSSYRLGQSVNLVSLTLNKIAENTYASEFQIGLRNSGFPGIDARFAPSTTDGYTGTLVVVPSSRPLTGSLVGSNIVAGTAWSIEAADTLNDTTNTSEQNATNLVFSTTVYVAPPQTFVFSGTSVDFIGDPNNAIINLGTYSGTPYRVGPTVNLNGGTLSAIDTSWPSDTVVILRNSANPLGRIAIRLSESIDAGTTVPISGAIDLSLPLTGITEPAYSYNLLLSTIPTGSTWTAEFIETFDDTDNIPEATISNLSISLNATSQTLPTVGTPTTFTDLGSINSVNASLASPLVINQPALGLNQVRWFKFTTPGFNQGGKFLDIYGKTDTVTTLSEDTEFALFSNSGLLIAADDDNSIGVLSQLSFGDSVTERPGVAATANDLEGSPMYGLNGDGLPAGTYWLAVAPWSSIPNNFNNGFVVNTDTGSIGANPWKLVFQTNVVSQAIISGNLTLAETVDDGIAGTESIGYTLSNGTNTYTGNVSVNDFSGGPYSITVPSGAPNGSYTLRFKGGTFLANVLNLTLSGSNLTGQNTTLQNGDIDQDGEVGPGDFEAVVSQFGGTGSADVDNDGEVGPGDFEIIVANFGLGDL